METEGPFVKVPIECVSQLFRKTRKTVTQELNAVVREVNNIAAEVDGDECGAIDDASARLGQLLDRLAKLKATAQQAAREEKRHLAGLRKRLELLAQPAPPPPPPPRPPSFPTSTSSSSPSPSHSLSHTPSPTLVRSTGSCLLPESPAERTRLDRCIVEYLLREGHSEAARELSEEAGITDLVTIELFERAKEVEAAIRAKDLGPALQWCEDNASRLRKLESTLEFKVRERAFLEMVRANKREEAILYAREHLQVHAPGHAEEVQRAMTTLAFTEPVAAPVPEYAALFADERWEELASEFLVEMQGVFGLTQPSMLEIVLQCGITVVKTPQCLEDSNRVAHCPTCSVEGRALGEGLPCAHHGQSFLICRQSGDPIGADNPPMALPNGRVYGSRAIRALARTPAGIGGASGVVGSTVTCPSTGYEYRFDQLRNVYII